MNYFPIGVFDSGVGGLTVLKELLEIMPNENFIYIADTKNLPYGTKTKDEIIEFSRNVMDFFFQNKVKAAVIACNTATAAALDTIANEYDFPIIGVIAPGAQCAAEATKSKKVALMATDFTVESRIYNSEIEKIDSDIVLKSIGCKHLVTAIEDGLAKEYVGKKIAHEYLELIEDFDYDTLILGCTHFPHVQEAIENYFEKVQRDTNIINPAQLTASTLKEVLKKEDCFNKDNNKSKVKYFSTDDPKGFEAKAATLMGTFAEDINVKKLVLPIGGENGKN